MSTAHIGPRRGRGSAPWSRPRRPAPPLAERSCRRNRMSSGTRSGSSSGRGRARRIGQRVVAAAHRPGEVQRQDRLRRSWRRIGRLRGDEDREHDDPQRAARTRRSRSSRRCPGATANAFTSAGRHIATQASTGTILAFTPRPMPNAERKLCSQGPDDLRPAQPGAVVAAVAEVVDDPGQPRLRRAAASLAQSRTAPQPGASLLQPAHSGRARSATASRTSVVGLVAAQRHKQHPVRRQSHGQAASGQLLLQLGEAILDLDREDLAGLGELVMCRPQRAGRP